MARHLDESSYDNAQTFAGRLAEAFTLSPKYVRTADIISSVAQTTPYGYIVSALDLGRDLNRVYHKEKGAKTDAALDVASMLPFLNKPGLKSANTFINRLRSRSKLRNVINSNVFGLKALDFVDDTYGSDRTSDNIRRTLAAGGSIHINPANRGKFNATKARTGKTTEELTHSKNPLTRKRAIFAQNAAKWHH